MAQAAARYRQVADRALRHYRIARRLHQMRIARRSAFGRKPQVLLLQMGKVGSRSILETLQLHDELTVHHLHVLSDDAVRGTERFYRSHWDGDAGPPRHLWTSQVVRRHLARELHRERVRVITLVRDPVARNVSSFFQLLDRSPQTTLDALSRLGDEQRSRRLLDLFLHEYGEDGIPYAAHDAAMTWFDQELRDVIGIDVYSIPFEKHAGHTVVSGMQADALVLRVEDLHRVAPAALEHYLNIGGVQLRSANVGSKKSYGSWYRHFLAHVRLPTNYVEQLYSSRYMRHFYTDVEAERLRRRWVEGRVYDGD